MGRAILFLLVELTLMAREYHAPSGFRVDLPDGWQATKTDSGHLVFTSPNPLKYAYIQPIRDRTADCAASLRQTLTGKGAANLRISAAGRGATIAEFVFQNGQAQGSILCAETGPRLGMYYGISAPAGEFARERPKLVAVLKSFAFENAAAAPASGGMERAPSLKTWREPNEGAYVMGIPDGWRATGGISRQGLPYGYRSSVDLSSPDGGSHIRSGDKRFGTCAVIGPAARSMPGIQQQIANGTMCSDQSGPQFGQMYVYRYLAQDLGLSGVTITATEDRRDLAQQATPRGNYIQTRYSIGEIRFRATRAGSPVAGVVLATTTLLIATSGRDLSPGQLAFDVTAFLGPPERFGWLGALTGAVMSSIRMNPAWFMQEQKLTKQAGEQILAARNASAERQQQAFWDRMAAADKRAEEVGHLLRGTVRVGDGKGNTYEAKAGSNYYFRDEDAARRTSRPDDAVRGTDQWPSPMVDLTPLEVLR